MSEPEPDPSLGDADARLRAEAQRNSIRDGGAYALMVGLGEGFFVPFAIFLRANNIAIGILSSLPQTLGSLLQLAAHWILRAFPSRRAFVCTAVSIQSVMLVLIPFAFLLGERGPLALIVLVCLYWVFGFMSNPVWQSWMGDITTEGDRGAFFGRRSMIGGACTFAAFIAAGVILHAYSAHGRTMELAGFAAIFALAFSARIVSVVFLLRQHEPPYKPERRRLLSLRTIRHDRAEDGERGFWLFVLYAGLMNFALYFSAPFFAPYMLRDLGLDYLTFTLLNASTLIVKLPAMRLWGRAIDRYGSRKILTVGGTLMPIVPVLWLFSTSIPYLVALQLYSGVVWAAFEMAALSMLFDTTTQRTRASGVALYNAAGGVAMLGGAILGGLIVRYNEVFPSKYLLVFAVSGALRFVVSLVFLPRLREVRTVEPITYSALLLRAISILPTRGPIFTIVPLKWRRRK